MHKLIIFCLTLAAIASSCTIDPCLTKGLFISGYQKFNEEVFEHYKNYSQKDWEAKDAKMDKFIDGCYKNFSNDLTSDEKKDFWIKYFKYKYYRHGRKVLSAIEDDANKFSLEIDEEIQVLFEDPEKDIKKILNEIYGDEIDKAIDDFVEGIKSIGDRIKEFLEKE